MSDQHWALLNKAGRCVGQLVLAESEQPSRRHACGQRYAKAVKVNRRGDLLLENYDGAGGWVVHQPSAERAALAARLDTMSRIELVEYIVQICGRAP